MLISKTCKTGLFNHMTITIKPAEDHYTVTIRRWFFKPFMKRIYVSLTNCEDTALWWAFKYAGRF